VTIAPAYLAEAASDALRRGRIVAVGNLAVLSAELADADALAALEQAERAGLVITARRAAVLNLANQIAAAAADPEPVWVERPPWLDLPGSRAVADPVLDLATPMKGPFRTRLLGDTAHSARAAIVLAKHAGLIPAVYAVPGTVPGVAVGCSAQAVLALPPRAARVQHSTRARLPLAEAEDTDVIAFRPDDGGPEHLALLIGPARDGQRASTPMLTRLHSSCLTGDVLASLKCDCGPQLRSAIAAIAAHPHGGMLLYLQQEGRGIGLLNKLRAYALQDQGWDTVDANTRLGFDPEERDFALAAAMASALGVTNIALMTNNPLKVAALAAHGLAVTRVAHQMPPNPHNAAYLGTKRDRQGHML
jgi:GTP cyclohydrolase II